MSHFQIFSASRMCWAVGEGGLSRSLQVAVNSVKARRNLNDDLVIEALQKALSELEAPTEAVKLAA